MKPIYLLGFVPPVLNVIGALCSRSDQPFVFGMPPMLAWVIGGVLATSLVMQIIYLSDKRDARRRSGSCGCTEAK
ncbi:DUF3311 domain-containing protein [Paraburkholderia caffeinilytica]|uniref:DUF3311 domain-containing protein n=1 Tax=Paraburkholderia caffeinilytica TaxID=1761016 RepID=UPI0038B991AA